MRILFTCLGNICRSPMAEGILKQKTQAIGLNWEITSNGTNRYHKGGPADDRAIFECQKNNIDISKHVARRFSAEDFDKNDLIICMAKDVYNEMQVFITSKEQLNKVVIKEFSDPWYGGDSGFAACFQNISNFCDEIIEKYKN